MDYLQKRSGSLQNQRSEKRREILGGDIGESRHITGIDYIPHSSH